MSDEHDRTRIGVHPVFQPLDRRDIEMIGRFIEQQQVRLLHKCFRQRHAAPPATRKFIHLLVGGQVELRDYRVDALFDVPAFVSIDPRVQGLELHHALAVEIQPGAVLVLSEQRFDLVQSGAHHVAYGQFHGFGQRLRELADDEILAADDLAAIRFEFPGDELERRGFSGAIPADQANALAGVDGELRLGKDLEVAKFQGHFVEAK